VVVRSIPATITLSTASGSYTLLQGAVPLDDRLTVSGDETFSGAAIQIETGFASGDKLSLTASIGGITGIYDGTKGILTLSGSGSASAYQSALRAVTFSTTSTSTAERGFKLTLGSAISFGGHYYEYVPGSYTWAQARTVALSKTFNGLSGYLANLTSADENNFVLTKIGADVWIGGSDSVTDGVWKWMDGPEAGITFWNGLSNGSAPSGRYANWNSGEPNNYGGREDYAQFYVGTGKWNDLGSGSRLGFLVEYGTDTPDIQTFSGKRIFSVTKATPSITAAPTAAPISYGQTLGFSILSGGVANTPGTFAWTTPSVPLAVGNSSQSVTFTPNDAANYSPVTTVVIVTANKASPTIAVAPTATPIGYGQTLAEAGLSLGKAIVDENEVAGLFSFASGNLRPGAGIAQQDVTFTPQDTNNYNPVALKVFVTVERAVLPTVTITAPDSLVYSASAKTHTAATTGPSSLTLTYKGQNGTTYNSTTAPTTVGDYTVTVTTSDANYSGKQVQNFSITTKPVTVAAEAKNKKYGEADPALTYRITNGGLVGNDALAGGLSRVPGEKAGAYAISSTLANGNYDVTFEPANLTIEAASIDPASITVTPPVNLTYDGTQKVFSASRNDVGGFTYSYEGVAPTGYAASNRAPTEAGTYRVTATSSDSNYTGSKIVNFTINKATPTIAKPPTPTPIAYGQTLAFSTLSGGEARAGETTVSGTFAFSNQTVAPSTGTSSQSVIFTPNDTANYNTVTIPVNVTVNPALIASGFSHTLYLSSGASNVTAWGLNTDGRLGVGNTNSPVNWAQAVRGIPTGATITGLSAGGTHSLILAGGQVYAAGSDRFGQLGQGGTNGVNKTGFTPVPMTSNTPVAVAAGGNHSLIVTASGKVFAFGDNTYGQLARSSNIASLGTLSQVDGLTNRIVSVAAGADHNLALDENGGVWVWGRNDSGQLGKNTRTSAERIPVRIISSGAKAVAAGYAHSLVLMQNGTVQGFGKNTLGQAGQSSATTYAKAPVTIPGMSGIRSISAGTDSSFAITESGQLYGWGYNSYGELLLGYASPISAPGVYGPTSSPVCTNISNVSGGGYSSLAVGAQGVVFAGRNDMGQSGNGPDPEQVVGDYFYETENLVMANLTMDLAGTTETLYDQIFVGNGAATLNGILNLMFVGAYTGPVYGSTQTFDLIWARDGINLVSGYQLAFKQSGYLVESMVADKKVNGVNGKVLQATVRAVVTAADLVKAADLAKPSLDGVESVSYGASTGIRALSVPTGVEMIYSYERPTGGVSSGAQYFVNGITYRVEQVSFLTNAWGDASVSGTTVTPLGNGRERVTLRVSSSGTAGYLRLTIETPQATGISAGVSNALTY
jgi:alpha-tubulin suppressor-like RCC1 family protein